jgi:ribonuclease HI
MDADGRADGWPEDHLEVVKGHAGHPENERVDGLANWEAVRAATGVATES